MAGTSASSRAYAAHIEQQHRKLEQQRDCRHTFKPVPGSTAYLQCLKCGLRCDND